MSALIKAEKAEEKKQMRAVEKKAQRAALFGPSFSFSNKANEANEAHKHKARNCCTHAHAPTPHPPEHQDGVDVGCGALRNSAYIERAIDVVKWMPMLLTCCSHSPDLAV